MCDVQFRFADQGGAALLAKMNQQLIGDEGHRNSMSLTELSQRMSAWLDSQYRAVLFDLGGEIVGYALYREIPEGVYLRQFFVKSSMRRKGIGRQAIMWLKKCPWKKIDKIRIEVLTHNTSAWAFWKAVGFNEYCMTMELDNN